MVPSTSKRLVDGVGGSYTYRSRRAGARVDSETDESEVDRPDELLTRKAVLKEKRGPGKGNHRKASIAAGNQRVPLPTRSNSDQWREGVDSASELNCLTEK